MAHAARSNENKGDLNSLEFLTACHSRQYGSAILTFIYKLNKCKAENRIGVSANSTVYNLQLKVRNGVRLHSRTEGFMKPSD